MPQRPNPQISNFRERLNWVVTNLDPEPQFRRFVADANDVFNALEDAYSSGRFVKGPQERIPQRRAWELALQTGNVSRLFLEWLYALYPDLKASQLEADSLAAFMALGTEISQNREHWRPAIRYFAEQRARLANVARTIYREVDISGEHLFEHLDFPLLVQPGWIRRVPIALSENSELKHLVDPAPGREFLARRLAGLSGDYSAYKGTLAYASRRVVKTEPQYNGEIFCVDNVLTDEGGFVGFSYYLARYFDYINTCEILGAELAEAYLGGAEIGPSTKLPYRGDAYDAFNLQNRAAYPGVNCLTIFLNYSEAKLKKGNYFLLHKRDETQLQAQNTVHVVPAGGHQGFAKGGDKEDTAIWRTMVREFAEELFDMEQLARQPEAWEDFQDDRKVAPIINTFFKGPSPAAKAYLHGFGLDPITLKPEVLVTIIVDWDKVPTGPGGFRLKFNWELQQRNQKLGTRHQWVKLSRSELLRQAAGRVQSLNDRFLDALPAGAACMIQTARHYEYLNLPGNR